MLNELLEEYKNQIKIEIKELDKVENEINNLNPNEKGYYFKLYELKEKRNDLNYFKNNLNYIIKWLENGHEYGVFEGIDNKYKAWNKNGYLIKDLSDLKDEGESQFE